MTLDKPLCLLESRVPSLQEVTKTPSYWVAAEPNEIVRYTSWHGHSDHSGQNTKADRGQAVWESIKLGSKVQVSS